VLSARVFEHILNAFVIPMRCIAQPETWDGQNRFHENVRPLLSEKDPEFPLVYLDLLIEHMYDRRYEFVLYACH
jgi:hypothetical protein